MAKKKVEVGTKYGRWTVVAIENEDTRNSLFVCECECGAKEKFVYVSNIKQTSGGCIACRGKRTILPRIKVGKQYGKLTILSHGGFDEHSSNRWNYVCTCGKKGTINQKTIRHAEKVGRTLSCGVYHNENLEHIHSNKEDKYNSNLLRLYSLFANLLGGK